jgi:hypothetical protein
VKSYLPAALCFLGMVTCTVLLHHKPAPAPTGKVEVIVHAPDGSVIPAVRRAPH